MKYKLMLAITTLSMLVGANLALADNDDLCAEDCPSGQVKTSYLDGQQVSCACMEQGSGMNDDSAISYGGEGEQNPDNPS